MLQKICIMLHILILKLYNSNQSAMLKISRDINLNNDHRLELWGFLLFFFFFLKYCNIWAVCERTYTRTTCKKQPVLSQFAEYDDTILESLDILLCFLAAPTSIHLGCWMYEVSRMLEFQCPLLHAQELTDCGQEEGSPLVAHSVQKRLPTILTLPSPLSSLPASYSLSSKVYCLLW